LLKQNKAKKLNYRRHNSRISSREKLKLQTCQRRITYNSVFIREREKRKLIKIFIDDHVIELFFKFKKQKDKTEIMKQLRN
jgi:hypothetical protein